MAYDLSAALISLRPGSSWSLSGDDYSGLNWQDSNNSPPTEEECRVEMARLKAAYNAKQYQRDRAKSYPSIVDQLDKLYHDGYDGWRAQIQAVKDQFPKP